MALPTKRFYIEGIHVTHDWTREQWEELARLVRGQHKGVGHPGDMALWVEYPVIEGGEPRLVQINPGDLVVINDRNEIKVWRTSAFTQCND